MKKHKKKHPMPRPARRDGLTPRQAAIFRNAAKAMDPGNTEQDGTAFVRAMAAAAEEGGDGNGRTARIEAEAEGPR